MSRLLYRLSYATLIEAETTIPTPPCSVKGSQKSRGKSRMRMKHTCKLTVRTYECDGYNHVNNAVYLNYLEYGRMEFLKDAGLDYRAFLQAGLALVVARICITYKTPAVYGDELIIETESIRFRKSFGVFQQDIRKGSTLVATAEVSWFCVDSQGKPTPLPPRFMLSALIPDSKVEPDTNLPSASK